MGPYLLPVRLPVQLRFPVDAGDDGVAGDNALDLAEGLDLVAISDEADGPGRHDVVPDLLLGP